VNYPEPPVPSFLFDLDGTLIDSLGLPEDTPMVTRDLLAARRAGALGVGLQSGGYGREELERSGAYRVYADPAEMLARVDELGVRADG
jgi:phosphoglycolate phosphatase-like HAD superfamily hydrolase